MNITVAIPTLNRPWFALQTIREVLREKPAQLKSILVIDQTPRENIPDEALHEFLNMDKTGLIQYVTRDKPGLTAARNDALQRCETEVLLFLDDDVLLPTGFVNFHLDAYLRHPEIIGLGGPVYHSQGKVPLEDLSTKNREHGTKEHFSGRNPGRFILDWREIMVGCNHSVLRSQAIAVGGYDENIVGGYYEDSEMTERLRKYGGGTIGFSPDCWLVHLRAPSGGCRVSKNPAHSESDKLSGYMIHAMRHLQGTERVALLYRALRAGPLRKENMSKIARWPAAWIGFFLAAGNAFGNRKHVSSPFTRGG